MTKYDWESKAEDEQAADEVTPGHMNLNININFDYTPPKDGTPVNPQLLIDALQGLFGQ